MTPGKKTRATTAGEEARSALDPLERALLRHHAEGVSQVVEVRVDDGTYQDLPTSVFYRSAADRLDVDEAALACCRGRVLDVGACVGALALPLQEADHAVTALELLPGAVEVMRERGVRDARVGDLWTFAPERGYDTVLALMNGTAMAGTLTGLIPLLGALALPLAPDGQILVDSTDLRGRDGRGKARRRDVPVPRGRHR